MDYAKEAGRLFWSDDRVLRAQATSCGIKSVGTIALLESLRGRATVNPALIDSTISSLIHNYYVGHSYDERIYELAAALDGWKPRGTAAAVMRQGPIADPEALIKFALAAIKRTTDDPEAVRGWVSAVAQWLTSIVDNELQATENLVYWLSNVISQDWMTPGLFVFAVGGVRDAIDVRKGIIDPMARAMGLVYEEISRQTDRASTALYLTGLMAHADSEDKGVVIRDMLLN